MDLSGLWEVSHRISTSQDARFVGLELVFKLLLVESDSKLIGRGSKVKVGGAVVRDEERSILELDGYTDGRNAFLFYRERAERAPERTVHGVIMWKIADHKLAAGTFDSSVAGVAGTSRARRITETENSN